MNQKMLNLAIDALDLSQSLLEKSIHHKTILHAYKTLSIYRSDTKLVPIRQLFDISGNQVCDLGHETCHFYVQPISNAHSASCNHCQRGIPNNKPHRLCPVLKENL